MPNRQEDYTGGPFQAEHLRPGDPYELDDGHPIECLPSGGRHAKASLNGGLTLKTDPDVEAAGFDAGFTPDEHNLRAPDIAVGNVPDAPGWVAGAPPLAVEYADTGQDEQDLQHKIRTLAYPGQQLEAPGILANPVPVEALYDPDAARETALRNLLQRRGYADLDAVREEGKKEGREEGWETGQLALVLRQLRRTIGQVPENESRRIGRLDRDGLGALAEALLDFRAKGDLTAWLERHG